jgi:hypothetical protein
VKYEQGMRKSVGIGPGTPVTWILLLALSQPTAALAATEEGRYAVRGAALVSCAIYERERKIQSPVYQVIGAWIDGYISGLNQGAPGIYDVASFESTELIAALLSEHCSKNPNDSLFAVLKLLTDKIAANKLTEPSEKVRVKRGERSVLLYSEILMRLQHKLAAMGYYTGTIDGAYSEATQQAIRRYQESIALNPTGFPDQLTLWRLFTS